MKKSAFSEEYAVFLDHLREARQRARLTQEHLARKLNRTQSWVSKVERGERRLDIVELWEICRTLGLPLTSFVARLDAALPAKSRSRRRRA